MSRPNCTCADRMTAEDGGHEGTCPMSVMHTGKLWFRPVGGEWQTAPFTFSRSAEEERLTAELTVLRQQVADLRAALSEAYKRTHDPKVERLIAKALAATQPQEVQG